jgi:hypothetical protein
MQLKTHMTQFFSFVDSKGKIGGYFGFPCSQCVLIKLSMGSQYTFQVHYMFLNMFPIAPHFVPYALSKTQHQKFEKKTSLVSYPESHLVIGPPSTRYPLFHW